MDKVRLGMIGIGGVGASRLDEALKTPEAEVVAICDVNDKNLAAAAEKCPAVPQFKDAGEMLANTKVDAVMLVVPHFLHAPMAIQVLERGAHVLVEKPMAIRVSECERMLAAAKKAGKTISVHHQKRIGQTHLAPIMRSGVLGPLVRATCISNSARNNAYYRSAAWRGKWKTEGGGVLINQAIHDIDAFVQMAGLPTEISARLANLFHDTEVEDTCTAALRYANGATGVFQANISSMSTSSLLEFECERGIVNQGKVGRVGRLPGTVYDYYDGESTEMFAKRPEMEWTDVTREPFAPGFLIRDFVLSIIEKRQPLVDAEGARDAVHFFNAIVLSHFLEKPMKLPLDPDEVDRVFADLAAGKWSLTRTFRKP